MTLLVVRILVTVVMTHGLRALGGRVGPRWGGLVMGLPSTTAIVLLFLGDERGSAFAVRATEGAILGLVAAVALALAYTFAAGHRQNTLGSLAMGVAVYVAAASALGQMTSLGVPSRLGVALAGVALGSVVARVLKVPGESTGRVSTSHARSLALRTALPVACVLTTTGLPGAVGERWAGLLSTFPSTFVAVIVITHLEAGPAAAVWTAQAFPRGNLSMIAFLAVVRLAAHRIGLAPAMGVGYLAALTTLFLMETFACRLFPALTTSKWGFDRPEMNSTIIWGSGTDGALDRSPTPPRLRCGVTVERVADRIATHDGGPDTRLLRDGLQACCRILNDGGATPVQKGCSLTPPLRPVCP